MNGDESLIDLRQPIHNLITLEYSGENQQLVEHKIGIAQYVNSLDGYNDFITHIGQAIYNSDLEVYIASQEGGSFKSIVNITGQAISLFGSLLGILSFFEIKPADISKSFADIQGALVAEFIEAKGSIDNIVRKISASSRLSSDEKTKLTMH